MCIWCICLSEVERERTPLFSISPTGNSTTILIGQRRIKKSRFMFSCFASCQPINKKQNKSLRRLPRERIGFIAWSATIFMMVRVSFVMPIILSFSGVSRVLPTSTRCTWTAPTSRMIPSKRATQRAASHLQLPAPTLALPRPSSTWPTTPFSIRRASRPLASWRQRKILSFSKRKLTLNTARKLTRSLVRSISLPLSIPPSPYLPLCLPTSNLLPSIHVSLPCSLARTCVFIWSKNSLFNKQVYWRLYICRIKYTCRKNFVNGTHAWTLTCIQTNIQTKIHAHLQTYICNSICIKKRICVYVYKYIYIYIYIYIYLYIYIYIYVYIYIYLYTHIHIYSYVYIYTYTQRPPDFLYCRYF